MRFEEHWLDYVPRRPELALDDATGAAYQRCMRELAGEGRAQDALAWVFRLAQEREQLGRIGATVPWLDRLALGFFDPEVDGPEGFGLIAYSVVPLPGIVDRPVAEAPDVRVDGTEFRTVVRTAMRSQEANMLAPKVAAVACFGRSSRVVQNGWLTCRHAVDVGGMVSFDDGSTGHVVDDWHDCIDAVLVGSGPAPPVGSERVPCIRGVAPGIAVAVTHRHGPSAGVYTIVDVDLNVGVVRSDLFPIRFTYDWEKSANGDSGALVLAHPCAEPLGMHQGRFLDGFGAGKAYGLCLYQLEDWGGLEVYL